MYTICIQVVCDESKEDGEKDERKAGRNINEDIIPQICGQLDCT